MHLARLGVAGLSPVAPGTAGSLLAAFAAPWLFLPLGWIGRIAVLALIFVIGALAAGKVEELRGRKDPGEVVVDELLGQWITYLPFAALGPVELGLGFLLFRLFDILKPWPVRASETWLPGGWGVMIDDALAGAYAMAVLGLARWALGGM